MPLDNQTGFEAPVPAAVRRQSARADALARASGAAGVAEPDPALTSDPAVDPAAPPVAPVSDPTADPAAAPAPVGDPPADDWEKRYRTLQGKYDAEVPHLRGELASMQRLIAAMQHAPAPTAPAAPATTVPVAATIAPEDIETYGEDLVTASRRWAAAEIQPRIDELVAQVRDLQGGQQHIQAETVQQRVHTSLDADPVLAGRWRDVNNDPLFIGWLQEIDPFSGSPRIELLRQAYSMGDAVRTARFFKTYLAEQTAVIEPPAAITPQTPPAGVASGRPSLEDLAAPGRSNTAPAPSGAPAEKRMWTSKQITAFYRDRTDGKYAGREADALRTEQDIFAAASEGRIRN